MSNDVAAEEVLSPTQLGLSVHNAIELFSYAGKKSPITAVSALEGALFEDGLGKINALVFGVAWIFYQN